MHSQTSSIISAQQFSVEYLEKLFVHANALKENVSKHGVLDILADKVMATLFYEPSTRTRLSFEASMQRLGGRVISTSNAKHYSSVTKGETITDTIKTIQQYADVIVLRHTERGSAMLAESVAQIPIINAGDGDGEHPTQALLDLYTIYQEKKTLNGLTVAMIGDLKHGRTVHSLSQLLNHYTIKQLFIAPPALQIPTWISEKISTEYEQHDNFQHAIQEADVLYITRLQKERFTNADEYNRYQGLYRITDKNLSSAKKDMIIMHPLPRIDEIAVEVDKDPRATYFRQVKNGMFVRMALLTTVFEREHKI